MKYYARKMLHRNNNLPANRMMGSICKKTFSSFSSTASIASVATLGLGLTFLLSYKPGLFHSAKGSSNADDHSSTDKQTYFEAAPRSISGQHPSFSEYAGTKSNGLAKKSRRLAIGSAAILGLMYFFGRKK